MPRQSAAISFGARWGSEMGHFPTPFPSRGQIDSFTPPRLVPVRQQIYESSWTGRQVVYTRGMRFEGSVTIRRFGSQLEQAGAIFSSGLLNALADAGDTFDLQLPVSTIAFGTVTPTAVTLDATTGLAQIVLAVADLSDSMAVGAIVRLGVRLYQIVHRADPNIYVAPGILPTSNDLVSLLPSAADTALPTIKARILSYGLGRTERERIEGPHTLGWAEALE